MNSRRQARALLAAVAAESTQLSIRMICPFCGGGADGEQSLVLDKLDSATVYCCHRASCGERGRLGLPGIQSRNRPAPQSPSRSPPESEPIPRDSPWAHWAHSAIQLATLEDSLRWAAACGLTQEAGNPLAALWHLRGFDGREIALQTRQAWPDGGKRVRTYRVLQDSPVYTYCPPREAHSRHLVIVEDALSASAAAARGARALALIGTHCSADLAYAISQATRSATVMLDPGAEMSAQRVATVIRSYGVDCSISYLRDDLKNLRRHEQETVLYSCLQN